MKTLRILNILGLLLVLVVNTLASVLPLNGITTGEISDSIPSLFTPAGYVFSIWGVIYLFLIGFSIFQALPSQKDNPRLIRLGLWFFISCIFNSAWIFLWHYGLFNLSLAVMVALLISLIGVYMSSGIGKLDKLQKSEKTFSTKIRKIEYWFIDISFGIYLGWISVATIANVSTVLIKANWNAFGISSQIWTTILIIIAGILGGLMVIKRNEIAYPLVLIWAFLGIFNVRTDFPIIQITSLIVISLLAIGVVISILKRQKRLRSA